MMVQNASPQKTPCKQSSAPFNQHDHEVLAGVTSRLVTFLSSCQYAARQIAPRRKANKAFKGNKGPDHTLPSNGTSGKGSVRAGAANGQVRSPGDIVSDEGSQPCEMSCWEQNASQRPFYLMRMRSEINHVFIFMLMLF